MASLFPAAASRASFFACLRRDCSEGLAGRSLAVDMAPPFTNRLYPLRDQAERRCNAPLLTPLQVGMLPLPRVVAPCQRAGGKYCGKPCVCQTALRLESASWARRIR